MPKTSEMKNSEFIKKEDVGRGLLVTMTTVTKKNVAKDGAEPEYKWCLAFAELEKPLVLNSTNIQLIEQITGSDDTDHWTGQKVVLYVDPTVSYQGKLIGGVRVRRPRPQGNVITQPLYLPQAIGTHPGSNGASKPAQAGPPPLPPMNIPSPAQPQPGEELGESQFNDDIPF